MLVAMGNLSRAVGAALALVFALSAPALADLGKPSGGVIKFVNVRKEPKAGTPIVGILLRGFTARWLETQGKFYRVRLSTGVEGWVPTNRTELIATSLKIGTPSRTPTVADIPAGPPVPGAYRIHMVDVGTGLAILIQGETFNMLFDGGSKDPVEKPDRLLAYLFGAIGPSGGPKCVPMGDQWQATASTLKINHLFLSHPHSDHASMLARVLECYEVANVWDSGSLNHTVTHRDFLKAVAAEAGTTYHTAAKIPASRSVTVKATKIKFPSSVSWVTFAEGESVTLDDEASFTALHANGVAKASNDNSTVLLVQLGERSLLLTGDSESGERDDPALKGIEKHLVDNYGAKLHVDILQVGHHGSLTSSRSAFLDLVKPTWALVSSGPTKYGTKTLPDKEVLKLFRDTGIKLVETYTNDKKCPEADRVGIDDKPGKPGGPGGCDNYVIDIAPSQ